MEQAKSFYSHEFPGSLYFHSSLPTVGGCLLVKYSISGIFSNPAYMPCFACTFFFFLPP